METVPTVAHEPEIEVEAELIPHTWGMEVRLTGMGFSDGESYRAIVLDEEGEEYPAGEFIGVGEEEMVCNLNSSLLREDAEGFEVVDSAGEQVLVSSF